MTRRLRVVHTPAGWSMITSAPPPVWFYRLTSAIHDVRAAGARRRRVTLLRKGPR